MDDWELKPARDLGLPPVERFRSYQRETGLVSHMSQMLWWSCMRGWLTVFNRLTIHGRANLPHSPSFVLVANHASHLDALILGAAVPLRLRERLFPLAAGDVFFETPALAAFSATVLNALPVWRKNCGAHAIQDLRQRLVDEPSIYILFPEGARSRDGKMLPFKAGLGMIMAETHVPVVPCYLDGSFDAFRPETFLPRAKKITVHIGEPRVFAEVRNRRQGWQEIVETLRQDICRLGGVKDESAVPCSHAEGG